jgi:integrase
VAAAKYLVTVLRSLLRFLFLTGVTERELASAVPAVAGWRGSHLPRAIPSVQVAALLGSCDRRRRVGRRDYAILTVLVRLGLRAGEVAALALSDVDWRRGEVVIRGKGRRDERLPLPADVGEAIVGYLRRGRPQSTSAMVFLRARAPHGPMTTFAVTLVVRRASERVGLGPWCAHRLRHTAGTELLRAGGSLAEVGQVLRHRHVATTAIYAKVDRTALRGLAQPWPGSEA